MRWQGLTPMRFLQRGGWLSLCLVAVLGSGASPAWATCGDYLAGHSEVLPKDWTILGEE